LTTTEQLPIVLDCRNDYETNVNWMTYCIGGIRCVKVNAYLTQELQFTNVSRLAGGIVAYDRILCEQAPD
jgi:predicted sulfurtransferase